MLRAGVVVISDGCFHGRREDRSGPLIIEKLHKDLGAEVESAVVPDDKEMIKEIDTAARKGIVKKNAASRKKSRMQRMVNAIDA